jgi:hypothetical protein
LIRSQRTCFQLCSSNQPVYHRILAWVLVLELVLVLVLELVRAPVTESCRMGSVAQAWATVLDPALAARLNRTGLLQPCTQQPELAQCLGF